MKMPRHMRQLRLRVDFRGPMLPVPELAAWEKRIAGKYRWCTRCRVAMPKAVHASTRHQDTHSYVGGQPDGQYIPHHWGVR